LKKSIRFAYEAHYSLSQDPTFREKELWIVLHGYGQLAEFFLRKFSPFFSEDRLFIAPEGTNYTYLEGFQGRVGANWMTRHEREIAIENNHRFLDQLLDSLLKKYPIMPQIKVLGFSQGAATLSRWVIHRREKISTLVLWAGGFALDMDLPAAKEKLESTRLIIAVGDQDELVTEESIQRQEEWIGRLGVPIERISFAGGHELNSEALAKIINEQD
jgi:predicted esterase